MTEIVTGSLVIAMLVLILTIGLLAARARLVPQGGTTITLNGSQDIPAMRGDVLLWALHGAGIAVPAGCGGNGTCGLCRVAVTGEGAGEAKATEKGVLSPAERRDHVRLACQVSLRGPVSVEVAAGILDAGSFDCRVRSNRMLAPLICELVLEIPAGHTVDYRAGGFMQIRAAPYRVKFADIDVPERFEETWQIMGWRRLSAASSVPVTRAYSFANRPEDAGTIVFNIRLAVPPAGREDEIPPGIVSSFLFSRKPGDLVAVSGPFGEFHVQPTGRDIVFIGGGVGMAPLRAMIHEQVALGTRRPITYFYGARSVADLFYLDEFESIAKSHGNFRFVPALSDPAPGDRWRGETGFVHESVRKVMASHPAPEDCEYYLCGPPVMISAVIATLEKLGVQQQSIYYDDFGG